MKMKPILFSHPMVEAILAGRKKVTRRIIDPAPNMESEPQRFPNVLDNPDDDGKWFWETSEGKTIMKFCPYEICTTLWVKETHFRYGNWFEMEGEYTKGGEQKYAFIPMTDEVRYMDNPPAEFFPGIKRNLLTNNWYKRPSLFMPLSCARIFLEVVGLRAQLLHDITIPDVINEGAGHDIRQMSLFGLNSEERRLLYRSRFETLWSSINGYSSWAANPFVWVIDFKKVPKPQLYGFSYP